MWARSQLLVDGQLKLEWTTVAGTVWHQRCVVCPNGVTTTPTPACLCAAGLGCGRPGGGRPLHPPAPRPQGAPSTCTLAIAGKPACHPAAVPGSPHLSFERLWRRCVAVAMWLCGEMLNTNGLPPNPLLFSPVGCRRTPRRRRTAPLTAACPPPPRPSPPARVSAGLGGAA